MTESAGLPEPSAVGWLAIIVAVLATVVVLYFIPVGIFGAATDCAGAIDSEICRFWKVVVFGAPLLLIAVWLSALGILRERGRMYWAITSLAIGGYVLFLLLA